MRLLELCAMSAMLCSAMHYTVQLSHEIIHWCVLFNLHLAMLANLSTITSPTDAHGADTNDFNHLRRDLCSSRLEQADIIKHVLFHDDDTLWDRFLAPLSSNPSDSHSLSGDNELVHKVVVALRTTCLPDLNEIQAIQAERHWNENRMMPPLVRRAILTRFISV